MTTGKRSAANSDKEALMRTMNKGCDRPRRDGAGSSKLRYQWRRLIHRSDDDCRPRPEGTCSMNRPGPDGGYRWR